MINLANAIGRVMMTAVTLPRSNTKEQMRLYAHTEYNQNDRDYILYCLGQDKPLDTR